VKAREIVTPELEERRRAWAQRMVDQGRAVVSDSGWALLSPDPHDPFPVGSLEFWDEGSEG
jgi:hypothetical protein